MAICEPYACAPEQAAAWEASTQDHLDLPPLLPLPFNWPTSLVPLRATEARRATIDHLLQRGEDSDDVADFAAHSKRAQRRSYRYRLTPKERSMAVRGALER